MLSRCLDSALIHLIWEGTGSEPIKLGLSGRPWSWTTWIRISLFLLGVMGKLLAMLWIVSAFQESILIKSLAPRESGMEPLSVGAK